MFTPGIKFLNFSKKTIVDIDLKSLEQKAQAHGNTTYTHPVVYMFGHRYRCATNTRASYRIFELFFALCTRV